MGDLRDQLLKAGLVSRDQAKKVDKDQRARRKARGDRALRAEADRANRQAEQRAAQQRAADRARGLDANKELEAKELLARVVQIAESNTLDCRIGGPKRWYYETASGALPCLELSDRATRMLESGQAAVIAAPTGRWWLVTGEGARRIEELAPDWIRCWNTR